MRIELHKSFRFEAAHHLPFAPVGHRCRHIHGHGYRVDVGVAGPLDPERRWVMDYGEILATCEPVRARLDHKLLNEIPGLEGGTAEELALFIWGELHGVLPGLFEVTVRETESSSCTYRGE